MKKKNAEFVGKSHTVTTKDKSREKSAHTSIYAEVTGKIIKQLESGLIPWRKPWSGNPEAACNYFTGKPYSLLNQLVLKHSGGYATFNQWINAGGKIRKGSKAEYIYFYKVAQKELDELDEDGNNKIAAYPVLRKYAVFHVSDVENIEAKPAAVAPVTISDGEKIISDYVKNSGISFFTEISDRAYYSPSVDAVKMPSISQFENAAEYYSTAFHELTHSTGHESRLNREGVTSSTYHPFGSEVYSREELIAEMGAAYLCNAAGIESKKTLKNSAAYIQSWIRALKNDDHMIIYAAARAEKAARYILDLLDPDPEKTEPTETENTSDPVTTADNSAAVTESENNIEKPEANFEFAINSGSLHMDLNVSMFFPAKIKDLKLLIPDIISGCEKEAIQKLYNYLNGCKEFYIRSAEKIRPLSEKFAEVDTAIQSFGKNNPPEEILQKWHDLKATDCKYNYYQREAKKYSRNAEMISKALQSTAKQDINEEKTLAIKNSVVVLTGSLNRSRATTSKMIASAGGKVTNSVSKNTNILVVGKYEEFNAPNGEKSEKLKKAEILNGKGYHIAIIDEKTLNNLLAKPS